MPAILARAGKGSRVVVESTILRKSKWDVDFKGDDIDITNFESSGIDEGTIGIVGLDWNIGGLWDASSNQLADPPGLFPRDNLGAILLYENLTDAIFWNLLTNRVLSSKNGAEVRQAVTFETSGKINGATFYAPGNLAVNASGVGGVAINSY